MGVSCCWIVGVLELPTKADVFPYFNWQINLKNLADKLKKTGTFDDPKRQFTFDIIIGVFITI